MGFVVLRFCGLGSGGNMSEQTPWMAENLLILFFDTIFVLHFLDHLLIFFLWPISRGENVKMFIFSDPPFAIRKCRLIMCTPNAVIHEVCPS